MRLSNNYLFRNLHLCMHHIRDQAQRQEYQNGVDKVLTDIIPAVFENGGNERRLVAG